MSWDGRMKSLSNTGSSLASNWTHQTLTSSSSLVWTEESETWAQRVYIDPWKKTKSDGSAGNLNSDHPLVFDNFLHDWIFSIQAPKKLLRSLEDWPSDIINALITFWFNWPVFESLRSALIYPWSSFAFQEIEFIASNATITADWTWISYLLAGNSSFRVKQFQKPRSVPHNN